MRNNIQKKLKQKILNIFLLLTIPFMSFSTAIYAAEEIELTEIKVNNIKSTMEDGISEVVNNLNDNGEHEVHGHINTENLEEGYYTAFIFDTLNSDWSSYDGFAFHIDNKGDEIIKINLNLQGKDGVNLKADNGQIILIKSDSSSMIEKVIVSDGAVGIYPGFDGNVYIPFVSLIEAQGDNTVYKDDYKSTLSEINLWGIPMTCEENIKTNFKLSGFSVINLGEIKGEYLTNDFEIMGSNRVMIPTAGESISKYEVNGKDNIVFQIPEYIDNVSITEDGVLKVKDSVDLQRIRICAGDGNIGETKEIELYNSWTVGKVYEDGVKVNILKSNEMYTILSQDNVFLNNKLILIFIIILASILILFWILFLYWRRRFKTRKG